jgi:hypothetical protein
MLQQAIASNELQPSQGPPRILKQGWILKKGGSGLLAKWRLKYMVLTLEQDAILSIYDEHDPSKLPKHEIHTRFIRIDPQDSLASTKRMDPFTVFSKSRKVSFTLIYTLYLYQNSFLLLEPWIPTSF